MDKTFQQAPTILQGPSSAMEIFDPFPQAAEDRAAKIEAFRKISLTFPDTRGHRIIFGDVPLNDLHGATQLDATNFDGWDPITDSCAIEVCQNFGKFAIRRGLPPQYTRVSFIPVPALKKISGKPHLDPIPKIKDQETDKPLTYQTLFGVFTHEKDGTIGHPHLRSLSERPQREVAKNRQINSDSKKTKQEAVHTARGIFSKGETLTTQQTLEIFVFDPLQRSYHQAPETRSEGVSSFLVQATAIYPTALTTTVLKPTPQLRIARTGRFIPIKQNLPSSQQTPTTGTINGI